MFTLNEALCLLAIVVAYGLTGRMDHDDTVMLEQARQRAATACDAGDAVLANIAIAEPADPQQVGLPTGAPFWAPRHPDLRASRIDIVDACASPSR